MWLPEGWWIITEKSTDGTRFTAGAKGLPEIESSAKFRSDRDATGVARKALRSMAYENQDSGWSALEILCWLNEKQAIPRRYDNENRRTKRTQSRAGVSG